MWVLFFIQEGGEELVASLNEIYNEDCLEGMKRMPDESVDLIVTDPPYLINYTRHIKGHRFSKPILNDNNNKQLIIDYIKECYRVMKDNTAMYMFASHKTVDVFKQELEKYFNVKNIIIWDKQRQGMGDTSTVFGFQYELIFFVSKGQPKINGKRLSDIWSFPKIVGKQQLHQNQKPVELITQCILKHSKEGDVVFDGFMGSGTTAEAAFNTGRKYIGFELDEDYYNVAIKRLEYRNSLITLF